MRELMQRKKLRLMAAVLSLFMILGLVNHFSSSASDPSPDPNDITEYVNVSLKDFYFSRDNKPVYFYKDGKMVEGTGENYTLRTGEKMKVAYVWDVPAGNMSQVANGKYFKVKIPSQDALLFDNLGEIPITDIGSFVIGGGYIKVTFDGNFEGKESIKDGKLELNASLTDKKFDEIVFQPKEADAGTKVTFTVKTHENQKPIVDPGVNPGITDASSNYAPLNPKGDLVKEGSQLTGGKANYIEYTLRVNFEAIKDTYKKGLHNLQFDEKQNVYLIDEMSDGLVVKPSTAHISVYTRSPLIDKKTKEVTEEISSNPLYHATVYSSVQNNQIKYGKKLFFDIVEKSEAQEPDFNKFKEDILAKPNRTIGFWNGNKIVVKIGTLPLNDLHYEDGYSNGATEFSERVDRYLDPVKNDWIGFERQLNAKQVEYVKKAYIGKPIVNFTLRYQASPRNKLKSDTSFSNDATMFWDVGKSTRVQKNVLMRSASGSATMEPFKGKYLVTKKWLGTKQSEVQVQLYKDDAPQGSPVMLNDSNGWKHEFTGLNNNGGTATFTVKEVNPPAGYRSVVVPVEGKYASDIENYEQIKLKLKKKWLDNGSALADPAVEKVIFYVHDADEPNPDTTNALHRVELSKANVSSEANVWEKEITVDKTDAKGKVYNFKVTEAKVAGFTQKGDAVGDISTGFTITNEKNPQIDLTLTKKWLNHKKTEIVPDVNSIRVSLHNNDVTSPALQTVDLSKSENWTKTIKVNKLDDSGTPINYVVAENQVAGFKKGVVTGNAASGFIITNEKEAPVIQKINLKLTKKWIDHTEADLANPAVEEVTLYLHNKKEATPTESNAIQTVVLKKSEGWTKTVELNQKDSEGADIEYVVSEKPVPGFEKGVVRGDIANGFVITNKKEAPAIEKINLKLTKKWLDKGAVLADPGLEKVTFYLHDAKETNRTELNALYAEEITKADSWTKTVSVKRKDDKGADIVYVVSEKAVDGFNQKGVTVGNHTEGFTITNEKIPPVAPYYPYYPIYIPVPEVPSVVPNTPAGETPVPPTPPAPNVPNDPVNEVPETPEVPEVVTVEDEDEEDIEVIGDNTPRGDTDIEEDEPKTKKKKKDSDKDVNLDDDSTPRGRKNILAKTGGLKTTFIPFAAMLAILALAFAAVQVFVRKKR